ncbi:MAG: penicillin-binding transpeptidase domain-containing protein [Desulfobacterales bacterium]|nr:penicillin-binding transpeptidase domain-containing protein [Desulfobacterales bacterium]
MKYSSSNPSKWRQYQAKLQRKSRLNHRAKKLPALILISFSAFIILSAAVWSSFWISERWSQASLIPTEPPPKKVEKQQPLLSRYELPALLDEFARDANLLSDVFVCEKNGTYYTIRTTIDTKLQRYIQQILKRSRTLQSAVVVLDASDGRVVAMVNRDSNGDRSNFSLKAEYPAASLFKIVSAAAALENSGYTPDTPLYFRGRRHTLYKSQLKQKKDRWTVETSLRKAFALSNNSVFGKLGIYVLGQAVLTEYAEKFGFNRRIPFDLPLEVSQIEVPNDPFGLAEIASGFNKRTVISPLHAALLASAAANKGKMPTPWLVDAIQGNNNRILYHADTNVLNQPVLGRAADDLTQLMQYSARSGTSRSVFRKLSRKKRFKRFELGAKTGTINDRLDRYKYDWITAYAKTPDGQRGITVGVLGVHGKILGTRSTELARAIIDFYFRI